MQPRTHTFRHTQPHKHLTSMANFSLQGWKVWLPEGGEISWTDWASYNICTNRTKATILPLLFTSVVHWLRKPAVSSLIVQHRVLFGMQTAKCWILVRINPMNSFEDGSPCRSTNCVCYFIRKQIQILCMLTCKDGYIFSTQRVMVVCECADEMRCWDLFSFLLESFYLYIKNIFVLLADTLVVAAVLQACSKG